MPTITARMPSSFWEPREVLGINPAESHFSCTAIVIPKEKRGQPQEPPRRCLQTFLSNECKDQACRLFDTFAHIDVASVGVSVGIKRALVHIAELTACLRLHKEPSRSQAEEVGSEWTDMVGQFVASERVSRRRAERERLRSAAVAELRAAPEQIIQPPVPSVPDLEDPEMRRALDRAARRARESQQQAPEVPPQYRPREQREQQLSHEGQPDRRRDAYYPQQVQVNLVQQQPVQDFDPRMPHQVLRREDAFLAALAVRRRAVQQQAEVRPVPNQDQVVVRDRALRPYPAHQREVIPQLGIENRPESRPYFHPPAEALGRRSVVALPPSMPVEPVVAPMNGGEVDDLQRLVDRLHQLREEIARGQVLPLRPSPQAPGVPILPIRNRVQEPEMAQVERDIAAPPPEHLRARRRAALPPAPAQPYVTRRQPLVECYICYEPFGRADDIIWCQGQCGQNIHRDCFETWQRYSGNVGRKCGFCRAR